MQINIEKTSGFCWGVVRTVEIAEETLAENTGSKVYVLGHIIHNPREIERLERAGLRTVTHEGIKDLAGQNAKVIIRAHGEPPSTYEMAKELGIEIIDATCPLVTGLQKKVKNFHKKGYQVVIYGKPQHPEIIGLRGVIDDDCIVIQTVEEAITKIDFNRKTVLLSQTTKDKKTFYDIKEAIESRVSLLIEGGEIKEKFESRDTLCKEVWGREDELINFAKSNQIIVFVAGRKSSNGLSLYNLCKRYNERTYFIEDLSEIENDWFANVESVGISGATSTPRWYLEKVRDEIDKRTALVEA